MFRTITSPSSGASSHKPYNALVCSCYQASLAVAWMYIHATAYGLPKEVAAYGLPIEVAAAYGLPIEAELSS